MVGDDASSLEVSVDTPLLLQKIPNDESSCTSAMENYFLRKKGMVLIIFIRRIIRTTWW